MRLMRPPAMLGVEKAYARLSVQVAVGGCSHDSCVWGGGWWLLGWGMTHGRPARLLDTKVANMKGVWQK